MNWKHSLGRKKFYSILAASAFEMIVGILMSLIDTAVAGHIIGTEGLAVMSLIAPITGLTVFTEGLFSVGTSMVYSEYKGKYQQDNADKAFGTGLICSVCIGILTSILVIGVLPSYLAYMDVSDTIIKLANDYLFFIFPQLALVPVYQMLCQMVITDGGEVIGTAANITETLLNLILSIILGQMMGILGIGLGTLISTTVSLGVVLIHFLSKRNSLHIRIAFDVHDLKRMLLFGANDSAMFFLMPVLSFITTKFVIYSFGEFYIPVLTIIYSIYDITMVFEATGEAMRPIMPIYVGDKNVPAIKNLLKSSLFINMMGSVVFSLFLFFASSFIPIAFDITEPVLLEACTNALKIYSIAGPGLALVANFNSYYLNTGKVSLAIMESILNGLVCVLALSIPLAMLFQIKGLILGYALAPYLTAVILFGYIYFRYGREQFPTLITDSDSPILNRTVLLENEAIMDFVNTAHVFMQENHIEKTIQSRVELTLEELLFLIRDKNLEEDKDNKSKKIYAECCVYIRKNEVDLSIWDNGIIFDITDTEDDIISFRSYFVQRLLSEHQGKKHMVATSFNKNFCQFHFD